MSLPAKTPFSAVATFSRLIVRDAFAAPPETDTLMTHLTAALDWLERAHDQCERGGVSYGYTVKGGWQAPYRETSGYILTTFYRAADALNRPELAQRAVQIARWLLSVQNPDGGFANPKYGQDGIVFDTGQDLFGLVRAFQREGDEAFLRGAERAGDWLVRVADDQGIWTRYEHLNTPHVYNTRTAWALLRLNQVLPKPEYEQIARANLDWALLNQDPSGFFNNNAFVSGDAPFTHNISYATCGLQESGWILGDERYTAAAKRCADGALRLMRGDGFIPGQISPQGSAAASYCCLTGNSQLAIVFAKLHHSTGDQRYRTAARQALQFVRERQALRGPDSYRGAIAGSYPIWGRYAPLSFPNWPAKFFADACLLQLDWESAA